MIVERGVGKEPSVTLGSVSPGTCFEFVRGNSISMFLRIDSEAEVIRYVGLITGTLHYTSPDSLVIPLRCKVVEF